LKFTSFTPTALFLPLAAAVIAASAITASGAAPASETIAMHGLNGSNQNGTATITDRGGKVLVSVNIANEPASASEPSHVHFGNCPTIKAIPAYNVGPILNGKAKSVVALSWATINSGKYVIMVHKSSAAMGTYVSCANIGTQSSTIKK
jgi:hypothetical protein